VAAFPLQCKVGVSAAPAIARFVPSALKTANFDDAATTLAPRCATKTITSPSALLACHNAIIFPAYFFVSL